MTTKGALKRGNKSMTAPHNLEDIPQTLKHADTPQHHSHLSKTTQHHITENGFTTYRIRHKECTLVLISIKRRYVLFLRTRRFSRIKCRWLKVIQQQTHAEMV